MARFNESGTKAVKTTNVAGGTAYAMTPELELATAVLTTFLKDSFYKSGSDKMDDIVDVLPKVKPEFAAKTAIYARTEYGMRSASHLVAAAIADSVKGTEWGKRFYSKVVYRPDDMAEIWALYGKYGDGHRFTHAMRKGFADALSRFDAYQLGKYRMSGKKVSLVDIVNTVHPDHSDAIKALVDDELRQTGTWEYQVSEAGKKEDKEGAKAKAWADLVAEKKIGYFALLRNLRNIVEEAPEVTDKACEMLTDKKLIKKSLVLPFRFLTAYKEIEKLTGKEAKKVLVALSKAIDISCENVPKFDGETLVAVDTSGSMYGWYGDDNYIEKAALFGAIMAKASLADVMVWGSHAKHMAVNPTDSVLTIANNIAAQSTGGTNMNLVFDEAQRAYDRIVILSDEQSWLHDNYYHNPKQARDRYATRVGKRPYVYSWDLAGHGSMQFPENDVATVAGWSDKVFDIMKLAETDKKALVKKIKAVEL